MVANRSYVYDLFRRAGLSDFGARTAQFLVERPLRIALIVAVAYVAGRIGARAVERFVRSVHGRSPLRRSSPRADLRTATMASALGRLVRFTASVIALLLVLGVVGVNLAPLLAGAGIVGVALGLGAQSLVRDMLAGLFIVGEDQYGVGDMVDLGEASGLVEDVNLRSTRLRGTDGTVWFVPNGQIHRVGNSSMGFAGAVVDVPVPNSADLSSVLRSMAEESQAFSQDPEWAPKLVDPPVLWGVHALDVSGPTIRVVVKTAALANGPVSRELRRRVVERLSREGVWSVGVPGS